MKKNHLLLGILLIFIGGVSLSSIFWEDKIPQKTTLIENKKYIEDLQVDSSIKNNKRKMLSNEPTNTKKETAEYHNLDDDSENALAIQAAQNKEDQRILVNAHRKEMMAKRKHYKIARTKWRKNLNEARKEAKLTGDYSKFEAIKKQEPGKE